MIRWFFRLLRIDNLLFKIKDYEVIEDDNNKNNNDFIWCLVGNIVEKHYYGEDKQIRIGTKQFSPNTKVFCYPILWGDGYEDIKVIGRPRKSNKFITIVMKAKYIKNWRLQKVYHPFIVKKMKETDGWDNSERSRNDINAMLKWLPERTVEVSD